MAVGCDCQKIWPATVASACSNCNDVFPHGMVCAGWRVRQGTYLPSEVAEELHNMQQHPELLAAMAKLQQLLNEAREYRRGLVAVASVRIPRQACTLEAWGGHPSPFCPIVSWVAIA